MFDYFSHVMAEELQIYDASRRFTQLPLENLVEWDREFEAAKIVREAQIKRWRLAHPVLAAKMDFEEERLRALAAEKRAEREAKRLSELNSDE